MNYYFSKFSPVQYILIALSLIPNEFNNFPIFFISDDISWRNNMIEILSGKVSNKFIILNKTDNFYEWSILRNSAINICSNSTFGYTAALLNNSNKSRKLRCIVPQWINQYEISFDKGWTSPEAFFDL